MDSSRMLTGLLLVVTTVGLAFGQNAELNCVIDDDGKIFLNGEEVIPPKKVGDPENDTTAMPVTVVEGRNVLGIYCHDGGFTGGIIASIDLNAVGTDDTVRTDATWKCTDGEPTDPSWYTDPDFDESAWRLTGEYGPLADDTGGNAKPFFERTGLEPANLWYHKALWLWTPKTCYIRKTFTSDMTTGAVMLRGNGVTYKVYLNGSLVGEQTDVPINREDPLVRWDNQTLNDGENVIAIEAVCLDSIHFAWFKAGVQWSASGKALTDGTWKYSWDEASGWNNTGFSDDAWLNIGTKNAYDPNTDPLSGANWIWPTDMSFRLVFDVPTVAVAGRPTALAPVSASVVGYEYYTLQGQRIPAHALQRVPASAVLLERALLSNGKSTTRTLRAAWR